MRDNDLFDHSLRDFPNNQQEPKKKEDLEEEKDDGKQKVQASLHELLHDETLGIENI